MKSSSKHSKNKLGIVFLALIVSYACSEEQKSDKIVVKLKESVLTKTMLDSALSSNANSAKLKEEFISDWIETEVLYRQAVKEGIQDDADYISLLNRSKKELAGTLYLKKILAENELIPSESEVEQYFNEYKEDFKLKDDLFKLNIMRTPTFEKAVQARTKILESSWNKAKDFFRTDSTLVFSTENLYKSEIEPVVLLRVINSLITKETSIILETEPGIFSIVSIEDKYAADSIPPFEVAKDKAKNLLTA
ncbi:MAG: hypothetical protein AB1394_16980, partial [Bacteroidota bacterium]